MDQKSFYMLQIAATVLSYIYIYMHKASSSVGLDVNPYKWDPQDVVHPSTPAREWQTSLMNASADLNPSKKCLQHDERT